MMRTTALSLCSLAIISVLAWSTYRYAVPRADSAIVAMSRGQYNVAREYYAIEADRGNPEAQNSLGNLYYLGLGVPHNIKRAAALYFKAASQGYADAQINLGNLYSQGNGVPTDAMRAFAWYKMSHISGSTIAENYLTQIAIEYTLSPLQISTVGEKWPNLRLLVAEGLQ